VDNPCEILQIIEKLNEEMWGFLIIILKRLKIITK
jgi:hypothetical protein